jgi:hypothetical protein|nr:MAG TPA: hypothetical protein [Caudoviricetes sp.]
MDEVYKPTIKKFLGKEVRVITVGLKQYIILKDMFDVLGRVKADGTWTNEKNKLLTFLNELNKIEYHQTLVAQLKQGKSKVEKEVDCLLIDATPLILTQFKPTARKGEQALNEWIEFMKWVDNLLQEHEAYKVILKDKEEQKSISKAISEETDGKMVVINTQISIIMAKLIGVYEQGIKKINKDELKIYQPQVTIDLIEVRQEALKIFEQQYLVLEDYKQASDFTVAYMKKKYHLD